MSIYTPSFFKLSDADYVPKRREISDVSSATEAVVTTTENHGYQVGQLVRIHVPGDYGMKLDGVVGTVITIPTDNTFSINIDTTILSAYSSPSYPPAYTQSHVVPITGTESNVA